MAGTTRTVTLTNAQVAALAALGFTLTDAPASPASTTKPKAKRAAKTFIGKAARNEVRSRLSVPAGVTLAEWVKAAEVKDGEARKAAHDERSTLLKMDLSNNGFSVKAVFEGLHIA
jgi:hypothetical protein